jgi:hypothetical protein
MRVPHFSRAFAREMGIFDEASRMGISRSSGVARKPESTCAKKKPRFARTGAMIHAPAYCGVKFWCALRLSMSWNSGVAGGRLLGLRNRTSK